MKPMMCDQNEQFFFVIDATKKRNKEDREHLKYIMIGLGRYLKNYFKTEFLIVEKNKNQNPFLS